MFLKVLIAKRMVKNIKITTVNPCTGVQCIKTQYLEIDAALNTLFGHFWITVLMPHLKPETLWFKCGIKY